MFGFIVIRAKYFIILTNKVSELEKRLKKLEDETKDIIKYYEDFFNAKNNE